MRPFEDFERTPLVLHDEVVFIPYKGGNLRRGKVIGFSPQHVRIQATRTINEWLRPTGHVYKI